MRRNEADGFTNSHTGVTTVNGKLRPGEDIPGLQLFWCHAT